MAIQVRSSDWQGFSAQKPAANTSFAPRPASLTRPSIAPSSSTSISSFQIVPSLGFWPNFKALLRAKCSPAESERLLAAFQSLHNEWFASLTLNDLDKIADSVEQELGMVVEAPE